MRADHIGRPAFATDGTGAIVWNASYKPFGEINASTGAPINLRFPGQWFSDESDLNQNWMRDYDPTTGRYIQADPLGLVDGASMYGYALQSPNRYTDPTGEFIPLLIFAGGIALGYLIDQELEKCSCNGLGADMRWAGLGAIAAGFGPSGLKSVRPMGSSPFSSAWSRGRYRLFPNDGVARSQFGRYGKKVARKIPYLGLAFTLFDGARLLNCWAKK